MYPRHSFYSFRILVDTLNKNKFVLVFPIVIILQSTLIYINIATDNDCNIKGVRFTIQVFIFNLLQL